MGLLNDFKVAYKLMILGIVSFIGMVIVGYTGYSALQDAKADMDKMYNTNLMSIYYVGRSRYNVRYSQVQACITPYTVRQDRLQSRRDKYDTAIKTMDDCIVQYEKIIAGDQEQQTILNSIKEAWGKYKTNSAQLMNMRVANAEDRSAMNYYEENVMPYAVQLGDEMAKLQDAASEDAQEMLKHSDEQVSAATRNMVILCAVIIAVLLVVSVVITKAVTGPLNEMVNICGLLRDGDFRDDNDISSTRGDEFGLMANTISSMRSTMNKLMRKTSSTTEQLAASSQELTASAHQSAQASEQVAQSVTNSASAVVEQQQQVGEAMEYIDQAMIAIGRMSDTANEVSQNANATNEQALAGSAAIETAVNQIVSVERIVNSSAATVDKLGHRSKEIGQIVETISGIAEQTNLLALNAAIEAARAGSQGRGFAVVADEVRKLAEESQEAAQRIAGLITGIQTDTAEAVSSMQEGSSAVKEGTRSVEQLRETFDHIKSASDGVMVKAKAMTSDLKTVSEYTENIKARSNNISANGGKVSGEMESVSAASQQQSASAEEIASASDSLATLAQELQSDLRKFQF